MRIVGLDVGRGYALACSLESFPSNIQKTFKFFRQNKLFYKLLTNKAGVDKLLWLEPTAIVLEPSGSWYSQFWESVAKNNGIAVYWVGHADLSHQRGSYGFTNKRDDEDALCLAACYFDDRFIDDVGKKRFINYRTIELTNQVRELYLQKEQLTKLRSSYIAQLKQRLSYEFPETANRQFNIGIKGYTPLVGWLAGTAKNAKCDRDWSVSVAKDLKIEISSYTKEHARQLLNLELRLSTCYRDIERVISNRCFDSYLEIFNKFGFGIDNKTLLLTLCYPFERFLVDRQPLIEREASNGKMQKRDRSLRKFQAFLGLSYAHVQSGNVKKRSFHGSTVSRSSLYVWAVCQIAPKQRGYKVDTPQGRELSDRYWELRQQGVKGKDALIRILFKATRMLYRELVKKFV